MDNQPIFDDFKRAIKDENGYLLASTIAPIPPANDAGRLYTFSRSSNSFTVQTDIRYVIIYNNNLQLSKAESTAWLEIYVAYWKAVVEILAAEEATNAQNGQADWTKVYNAWRDVVNTLIKNYNNGSLPAWTIPCLYIGGKYLRNFAIKADNHVAKTKGDVTFNAGFQDDIVGGIGKNENLEDAARVLYKVFGMCIGDRAPEHESKKWALIYVTTLMFKTYFKLSSISLCKNLIRSLKASQHDMPSLDRYPPSHQVTFNYYVGVIHFLEEDYRTAEYHLTEAWNLCHKDAKRNQELILTYLIPCHLLTTGTLPTSTLLSPYPRLKSLFWPLASCIKRGDLSGFDAALQAGEEEFVKRRIYLTLERGRDLAMRNLFRKVFRAGGLDALKEGQSEADQIRRTRVPLKEFEAAVRISLGDKAATVDADEVECYVANMIYKNFMKGYISRAHGIVVLSKAGAFPGTGI